MPIALQVTILLALFVFAGFAIHKSRRDLAEDSDLLPGDRIVKIVGPLALLIGTIWLSVNWLR